MQFRSWVNGAYIYSTHGRLTWFFKMCDGYGFEVATNIRDKKGVMIYENDIVRCEKPLYGSEPLIDRVTMLSPSEWRYGQFGSLTVAFKYQFAIVEVIGHIHEVKQ